MSQAKTPYRHHNFIKVKVNHFWNNDPIIIKNVKYYPHLHSHIHVTLFFYPLNHEIFILPLEGFLFPLSSLSPPYLRLIQKLVMKEKSWLINWLSKIIYLCGTRLLNCRDISSIHPPLGSTFQNVNHLSSLNVCWCWYTH